jgi:colicin import membrane protein
MKLAIAFLVSCLGMFCASAQSQPSISPEPLTSPSYEAQRTHVEEERSRAQAQFDEAAVLCYQRFAVNDCLREARTARRDVFADLRKQSLALRDAQARQKAVQR